MRRLNVFWLHQPTKRRILWITAVLMVFLCIYAITSLPRSPSTSVPSVAQQQQQQQLASQECESVCASRLVGKDKKVRSLLRTQSALQVERMLWKARTLNAMASLQGEATGWLYFSEEELKGCDILMANAEAQREACDVRRILIERMESVAKIPAAGSSSCPSRPADAIVCSLHNPTGSCYHIHMLGHCLSYALQHNKVLVLDDSTWQNGQHCGRRRGWQCFFDSFGKDSCDVKLIPSNVGSGGTTNGKTPAGYRFWNPSGQSAYFVPPDLEKRIASFHVDPPMWVKGIMMRYTFQVKMEEFFLDLLKEHAKRLKHPYAGIHVRRGDKIGSEAQKHEGWEYMEHVEAFFKENHPDGPRTVYVATDEPSLVAELQRDYGDRFHFETVNEASTLANAPLNVRNMNCLGTRLIILDIVMLANADFFVGTFSSQVSRVVYELVQSRFPERTYMYPANPKEPLGERRSWKGAASTFSVPNERHNALQVRAVSLDEGWYYGS